MPQPKKYNREFLFVEIAKIVAHPHTVITDHDNSRALAIMVLLDIYICNFMEESNNNGKYCIYDQHAIKFLDFVCFKLGIDYHPLLTPEDVLKAKN